MHLHHQIAAVVVEAAAAEVAEAVEVVVTDMQFNHSNRLLMQFHITGRCNLHCKHCYRTEGNVETLSFKDIINVIEQYKVLQAKYNKEHKIKSRGHINITGGEPFVRKDIKEILQYLGDNKRFFSYGILSNGSFIDKEIISLLKSTEVSFVQLSIDVNRKMHDELRAVGDYDRVFAIAEKLEQSQIKTYISFTANSENYKYLPKIAYECRKRSITKLWSDRLVPIGNGEELESLKITSDIMPKYINILKKSQGNILTKYRYPKTQVTMNRALQFINSSDCKYSCSAGDSLITVDEFGRIMPCRRMPIYCGDIFSSTLEEVYYNHEQFCELRMRYIPKDCLKCKYHDLCRGGAKCQSYAEFGTIHRADPACVLKGKC